MNLLLLTTALTLAGAPSEPSSDSITIARLQYEGGGDWYANPSSLPNLLSAIRERTGIAVARNEITVRPLDPVLHDYPYLYMTGHGDVRFSPAERSALRDYLLAGGFLHADDNYGLDESFRKEIGEIFPETELQEIPAGHPIFHEVYDFPEGLPKIHEHDGEAPQAFGIFHGGRLVVFYSYESDLGDGWEEEGTDPWYFKEFSEKYAYPLGINIVFYALTH